MVETSRPDMREVRHRTLRALATAGVSVPAHLPVLEDALRLRDANVVIDRLSSMNPVLAVACGLERTSALAWLSRESLMSSLTPRELLFLEKGIGKPEQFQASVEAMWALAWSLELVPTIDFWKPSDDELVRAFPYLRKDQTTESFRARSSLRPLVEVIAALDLAFCLHWKVRQCSLVGEQMPAGLSPHVVIERRLALEWLLSEEAWDDISLDT